MYNNFGRIHQTLRVSPAVDAAVADHVWSIEEIAAASVNAGALGRMDTVYLSTCTVRATLHAVQRTG